MSTDHPILPRTPAMPGILPHFSEFLRYAWASGVALTVDALILILLVEWAGVHYLWAAALAFCAGLATLYLLSVCWVFNQRRYSNRGVEFFVFSIIGLGGLLVTLTVMALATEGAQLDYRHSKFLAAGTSFLFNFALRKGLVFKGAAHAHS